MKDLCIIGLLCMAPGMMVVAADCQNGLFDAVKNGDANDVRNMINRGADVHAIDGDGWTPILFASWYGHCEVVQVLLETGACIEETEPSGWTPLICAAWGGKDAIVRLLLFKGAQVENSGTTGFTPLMAAAEQGHEEILALLLQASADVNVSDNSDERTALLCAAKQGRVPIIQALLRAGAHKNHRDREGKTALAIAAWSGHRKVVQALLAAGVDIHIRNVRDEDALMAASKRGQTIIVADLLKAGAPIDRVDTKGRTALAAAVAGNHLDVVRELVRAGAKLDATDNDGQGLLVVAKRNSNLKILRTLYAAGCEDSVFPHWVSTGSLVALLLGATQWSAADIGAGCPNFITQLQPTTRLKSWGREIVQALEKRYRQLNQRESTSDLFARCCYYVLRCQALDSLCDEVMILKKEAPRCGVSLAAGLETFKTRLQAESQIRDRLKRHLLASVSRIGLGESLLHREQNNLIEAFPELHSWFKPLLIEDRLRWRSVREILVSKLNGEMADQILRLCISSSAEWLELQVGVALATRLEKDRRFRRDHETCSDRGLRKRSICSSFQSPSLCKKYKKS